MMMAFAPNKTSSGFNQGGFKFVKPQASLRVGKQRPERALSAGGSRKGPRKQLYSSQARGPQQENEKQPIEQQTQQQKMDLIQFYCRILEKGLKNTNPIIVQKGGRDAFLQDVEKLKNAQEAIHVTLQRLNQDAGAVDANNPHPPKVIDQIPTGLQSGVNQSAHDSSVVSPICLDSLQVGTLEQKMVEGESPDNGSKLQSKLGVLDYSQENIQLRSRTPVIEFNVEGHEKMKQKFDIVIDEKTSDNKNAKKNQTESNNQTLVVDDQLRDSLPPQLLLMPPDMAQEVNLRNMLEKSLLNQEVSIQTGGDKQRVNIISKFNKSQTSQSHAPANGASIDNSFQVPLEFPGPGEVIQQLSPVVEEAKVGKQQSPGEELFDNQVHLHRQRQRNNEDKLKNTQSSQHVSPQKGMLSLIAKSGTNDMWSPPDLHEKKLKLQKQASPEKTPRTPRKDGTPKTLIPKKQTLDLPLSSQLMHVQALQGQLQPTHGIGGLSTGAQQQQRSTIVPNLSKPQLTVNKMTLEPLNPMIVNIGSLSRFSNAEGHAGWELGDGCFNPYRRGTVNEQRFCKPGGLRAQTANSALGGRQRQTGATGASGLIRVEDRQTNTMNNTMNGFNNIMDQMPIQKDGTVVLQATLTMGNRQYLLNSMEQTSKNFNKTLKDPKVKKTLNQTHSASPPKTNIVQIQSSDLKVRYVQQHSNNPTVIQTTNHFMHTQTNNTYASDASLLFKCAQISPRNLAHLPDNHTPEAIAACPSNLQRRYEGSSFMMHHQQQNSNQKGASHNFEERRNSNPLPSVQQARSRENQASILHQVSANASREFANNSGSFSRRQQQSRVHNQSQDKNMRKNVLAKTKNQVIEYTTNARTNVATSQLEVNVPAAIIAQGNSSSQPHNQSSSKQRFIQFGEGTIEVGDSTPNNATLTVGHSKSGSKNRLFSANNPTVGEGLIDGGGSKNHPFSFHTNSIGLEDMMNGTHFANQTPIPIAGGNSPQQQQRNKNSNNKDNLLELGKHEQQLRAVRRLNDSGGQLIQPGEAVLPQQVSGTKLNLQKNVSMSFPDARPSGSQAHPGGTTSSNFLSTTTHTKQQVPQQSLNQTGISFSKTGGGFSESAHNSVRVSLQSRKQKKAIEFKILQMNLVMAPTAEKSNMMTCELDLSQHQMISHKRVFSGGHISNMISRTLMPQNYNQIQKQVMSSQNTNSQGQIGSSSNIGLKHQPSVKNWQEINQVKISMGDLNQAQQVPTTLEQIQKLNMIKIQRNMPVAGHTTSGSGGVFSNGAQKRGMTPVGALSQRSSVASAMVSQQQRNARGNLAMLLNSNNAPQTNDMEIPPINQARVQTTKESKRASVANQGYDGDKTSIQMNNNTVRSYNQPNVMSNKSYQSKTFGRKAFGSNNGSNSIKNQDIAHQLSETTLFLKREKQSEYSALGSNRLQPSSNVAPVMQPQSTNYEQLDHKPSSTIIEPQFLESSANLNEKILNHDYEQHQKHQIKVRVSQYPKHRTSNLFRGINAVGGGPHNLLLRGLLQQQPRGTFPAGAQFDAQINEGLLQTQ